MKRLLEVQDISFAYHDGPMIFEHVSFSLEEGQILSIIGPNGAGKSTLLGCLVGQYTPRSGEILIGGAPLRSLPRRKVAQMVGFVPQDQKLTFSYDVRTFVVMGRTPYISTFRVPSKTDYQLADQAIAELGITHLNYRPCTEISGGERQKAAIARVVVQESKVVVLDEPTSALDFGNQMRTLNMIRKLARQGYAIIMTTHNPDHAIMVGGLVAALDQHGTLRVGPVEDIIRSDLLTNMYQVDVRVPYVDEVHRSACLTSLW